MRIGNAVRLGFALALLVVAKLAAAQHIGIVACEADTVFAAELVSMKPAADGEYDVDVKVLRTLQGRVGKTMTVRGVDEIVFKQYRLGDEAVILTNGKDFLRIESIDAEAVVKKILGDCRWMKEQAAR